ncbi:MarR family transcriptional regulator [Geomonas nitrogeniifigens]|uniref:MarR family transcriptional regulator n=1 Tax=Geomonas diazotrophica TaxID=2843197 RepID=A0ABX8JWG4_9BACT|nr:MarR family transcriptional regulator [Geomonas nitrogeniifigens]QXE88945.1 MarR family transcriptional regulator [Geomonas nitrogeniifigens]
MLINSPHIRGSQLANDTYLRAVTGGGIVDRLEAKGLLSRTRSAEDRRDVAHQGPCVRTANGDT